MEHVQESESSNFSDCPICNKKFPKNTIEIHVDKCLYLCSTSNHDDEKENKRTFSIFKPRSPAVSKRPRLDVSSNKQSEKNNNNNVINLSDDEDNYQSKQPTDHASTSRATSSNSENPVSAIIPLAEKVRPESLEDFIGQNHIMSKNAVLRTVLEKNEIPSMIFWGPPGCGKTTLAHIIANQCKKTQNIRFSKLSATMAGVNEVKEVVKIAKNEQRYKKKTILFMDEIHRFNKLQQDIFLPHVESGVITLIGATTENPSFSLNSALLSRCRVIVLEKLETENLVAILHRALREYDGFCVESLNDFPDFENLDFMPKIMIDKESLTWLADMCDGDARIALNSLQLAIQTLVPHENCDNTEREVKIITLDVIKEGIKKSHLLYDRKGDQHFDIISALHKSIRASDDNAALYWCTRMIVSGEDPRYICRRMVRAASEDIGLADPQAISVALSALQSVQLIGMPESDCIIAQCAVYLARAPKSRETYQAMMKCKEDITNFKGPLPSVPLHLRNAPTKLMKQLGYGKGYNMQNKDESGLTYMPEGMEDTNYFSE